MMLNMIGAGRLGKTIGYLFKQHGVCQMGGICNLSTESAMRAAQFIGEGVCYNDIHALPHAKVTLIATPDCMIASSALSLSQNPSLQAGDIVFHCSGALSSDLLFPLKQRGCMIASIHPMHSFAFPETSIADYAGTYCALEGNLDARVLLRDWFEAIGSIVYHISASSKLMYHVAGVFASNYVLTLASQAQDCLQEAGLDNDTSIVVISHLMRGTMRNLDIMHSPAAALTGPIKRFDCSTIQQHLDILKDTERRSLYAALGKATIPLATLGEPEAQILGDILS